MDADVLMEAVNREDDSSLTNDNIDMLLNLIGNSDNQNDVQESFPMAYDYTQAAKSWWRYFKKQPINNTAMCYTCGSIFNRGPKQSTTSLSHHLKMYHREEFILIQQAKDADQHVNQRHTVKQEQKAAKRKSPELAVQESGEYLNRKKSAFNLSLIEAVKRRSQLYDNHQKHSDIKLNELWNSISIEVGVSPQIAKKCWQSLSQRYKKEMKIAIRDNFLYNPKWPYFYELNFLDEHFKTDNRQISNASNNSTDYNATNYLNAQVSATSFLNNIFNSACTKSSIDEEENGSTDSAIASLSEHSDQHESNLEHNDNHKPDTTFLAIHQLLSAANNEQPNDQITICPDKFNELSLKRSRKRKAPPARIEQPSLSGSFDYLEDQDLLFGKIVALRLKTLATDQNRLMKILIEQLFERQERGIALQ